VSAPGEPLLVGPLDGTIAWRDGRAVSRARFVALAERLAARLPAQGAALHLATDRLAFAVGFAAALLKGHPSLMPPNHAAHTVERLRGAFPGTYALLEPGGDAYGLEPIAVELEGDLPDPSAAVPRLDADAVAAQVFTSGSTGDPVPNAKTWGLLVANARAAAARLAALAGRPSLDGLSLVATVPPQHMYGFESSVLVAMVGGAAFDAGRPFFPADIAAALQRLPRPRMLVTTPLHLKACLDAGLPLPPCDLVVSATAPLAPQLATRAEAAFACPLFEIYGCTEAGQVATRRTLAGPEWTTFDGVVLAGDGDRVVASGGHVPAPVTLGDVLEVVDATTFRLLGRSNDLVNIAGKRSSLSHLAFHLNAIEGVRDGAFWLPAEADGADAGDAPTARLLAFVVAPGVAVEAIRNGLRARVDPAFLPRRIVHVEALPRARPASCRRRRWTPSPARRWSASPRPHAAPAPATRRPRAVRPAAAGGRHDGRDAHGRGGGRPPLVRRAIFRATRSGPACCCSPRRWKRSPPSRRSSPRSAPRRGSPSPSSSRRCDRARGSPSA
jgi:acyl-CoA synthetase (AMP-forming)/AMP-acid ligase II